MMMRPILTFVITISYLHYVSIAQPNSAAPHHHNLVSEDFKPECTNNVTGLAQYCEPQYVNAAYLKIPVANNTCDGEEFCTSMNWQFKGDETCNECDKERHSTDKMTDDNHDTGIDVTWWMSSPLSTYPDIHSQPVSVVLDLRKSFEISYVRILFQYMYPNAFAIYKKTRKNSQWEAWAYYAQGNQCRRDWGVPPNAPTMPMSTVARCFYNSMGMETGRTKGNELVFQVLQSGMEGIQMKPGELNDNLLEWTTATELKLEFKRMNYFYDSQMTKASQKGYFYSIRDISIGGKCSCNGHAGQCHPNTDRDGVENPLCTCQHNTTGDDCERCRPQYNDRPWKRATLTDANECIACNCNGLSSTCEFNNTLYDATGHGGYCTSCIYNTGGPHCEECRENYYRLPGPQQGCENCHCDQLGSRSMQCNVVSAQCQCKPGVQGLQCRECKPTHYNMGPNGCLDCKCDMRGTKHNTDDRDRYCNDDGMCNCKEHVEPSVETAKKCDRCLPGYFNLDMQNPYGCSKCFCYGHSTDCTTHGSYWSHTERTAFTFENDGWSLDLEFGSAGTMTHKDGMVFVSNARNGDHFLAPKKFLGDQYSSYGRNMSFKVMIRPNADEYPTPYYNDVILESNDLIAMALLPKVRNADDYFELVLHEKAQDKYRQQIWSDVSGHPLTFEKFALLLSNLTAIKLRVFDLDATYLDQFRLQSATIRPVQSVDKAEAAWIEKCTCPTGHTGDQCERCEPGYRRETEFGGRMSRCVKCECHGHATECDAESGACLCKHNTDGPTCDICAVGYYGDATSKDAKACKKCPCPDDTSCVANKQGDPQCTNCPYSTTGNLCTECMDGYFGQPNADDVLKCQKCDCNGNVQKYNIGNCNKVTGKCLKCEYKTDGDHCERCKHGYYGDALSTPSNGPDYKCQLCACFATGTVLTKGVALNFLPCSQPDGQCECRPHYDKRTCVECEQGFYDYKNGCKDCNCNRIGSKEGGLCENSGQCICKDGVGGLKCDQCLPGFYGFKNIDIEGCARCDCDPIGTDNSVQHCNVDSGQCTCLANIVGRRCDQCAENFYGLARERTCRECDACYTLIQKNVNEHRRNLKTFKDLIDGIRDNPKLLDEEQFVARMEEVKKSVKEMQDKIGAETGDTTSLRRKLKDLEDKLTAAGEAVETIKENQRDTENAMKGSNDAVEKFNEDDAEFKAKLERLELALKLTLQELEVKEETAGGTNSQSSKELKDLAVQARRLAESHQNKTNSIEEFLKHLTEVSENARNTATGAINENVDGDKELMELDEKLNTLELLLNRTETLANIEEERSKKLHDDYIDKKQKINNYKLPALTKGDENTEKVEASINQQSKLAQERVDEAIQFAKELDKLEAEVQDALADVLDVQQKYDNAIGDIDAAKTEAEEAVKNAQAIFDQANKTVNSLKDYSSAYDKLNKTAEEQLKKIPEISKTIAAAEEEINKHKNVLNDRNVQSNEVLSNAKQTKNAADTLHKNTVTLINTTSLNHKEATELAEKWNKVQTDAEKMRDNFHTYEDNAKANKDGNDELLRKVTSQKTQAKNIRGKIDELEMKIKQIEHNIDGSADVSGDDMKALMEQLTDLEKELNDSEIEKNISHLEKTASDQTYRLNQQLVEIDVLEKEVKSIREIISVMPNDCQEATPNLESED